MKLYVTESDSERWISFMSMTRGDHVSSRLLEVELAFALYRKESAGELNKGGASSIMKAFLRDVDRNRIRLFPISQDILHRAASMAAEAGRACLLRALDGIHVATVMELGCTMLVTSDVRMRKAAEHWKIRIADGA